MANLSDFSIRVKSNNRKSLEIFFQTQKSTECFNEEYKTINNNVYLLFSGECKGSINNGNNEKGLNNIDIENISNDIIDKLTNSNLLSKSKILSCEIEAFEYQEDSDGYVNHYRYNNGEIIVEEEIDLREEKNIKYECDKNNNGEKYNFRDFFFDNAFKLGTNQEDIEQKKVNNKEYGEVDDNPENYEIDNGVLIGYQGDSESPEGVKRIEDYLRIDERKIRKIILPSSLEILPFTGFADFKNLEVLELPNPLIPYDGDNMLGIQYYEYAQPKIMKNKFVICGEALFYYTSDEEEIIVPNGIKVIREYAFSYNDNIKKVTLPESLEYICANAFSNCINLEEINIPSNVKFIGKNAFNGCSKLNKPELPENLELDTNAF